MQYFVKVLCLILCVVLCLSFSACGKHDLPLPTESDESQTVSGTKEPEPKKLKVNPLTGLETLNDDEVGFRPTAITINNISVAQSVQAGIDSADVVFEVVVEGGITRLLALFKAPRADMGKIGTVRSARVVFGELAASMNAVLFHHGQDEKYFPDRAKALNLTKIVIDSDKNGQRIKNGKSSEHTLYTSGESLRKEIISRGYNKGNETEPWLNFVNDKQVGENPAKSVTVRFNNSSISNFTYDDSSCSYVRGARGETLKNYFSSNTSKFTNVFVLYTTQEPYSDNYHTKIGLSGGSGYYITKGGYEKITWSKSGDFKPISFKAADGTSLKVSAGNSYVCLVNQNASNTFTAE